MKIRGIEGTKRRKSFQISGNTSKQGNKEAPISKKQPIYPNLIYSNNCKFIVKSVNTLSIYVIVKTMEKTQKLGKTIV